LNHSHIFARRSLAAETGLNFLPVTAGNPSADKASNIGPFIRPQPRFIEKKIMGIGWVDSRGRALDVDADAKVFR